jgi:ATP-dependent RNA helicase DDX5/DBP2
MCLHLCAPCIVQTVRFLHTQLVGEGYRAVLLHGQRSQAERDEAMRDFRSGKAQACGLW